MAGSLCFKLACGIVIMCMFVLGAPRAHAITCSQVATATAPCVSYLKSAGGSPPPAPCCNSARALLAAAKTTPDRQQACRCLKTIAANVPGLNYGLAASLPAKCGFTTPFPISLSTDCNRVH